MLRSILLMSASQSCDVRHWERFEELNLEPEEFMSGGQKLWESIGITDRGISAISKALSLGWADRETELCERLGVRMICCRDSAYPKALLDLNDAPLLVYVWGNKFFPAKEAIGVVGTRRCSSYGASTAREIGMTAARRGICTVSGGASGIDAAAHKGSLEAGGVTVAVLGTGVDRVYPSGHRELFDRIKSNGALVSEYRLGANGEAWHFPRRNRIIAALSQRTVVVEAPIKSGAMITARHAAELGRDVWAVPGRICDDFSAGSNRLIFDGAFPLVDMEVFFGETNIQRTLFSEEPSEKKPEVVLSESEKKIIELLAIHGDRTIDNLAGEAKMSAADVFKMMSLMSLRGLVRASGPGRYSAAD